MKFKTKVKSAKELIKCWHESWNGEVYVSFSGGKDSTVLLHLVRNLYPETKAVFSNTGLEFPEIIKFVKTFENVDIIKPKISFLQVLNKYGYPVISKSVSMAISRYRNTKRKDQKQYRLYGKTVNGKKFSAGTIPKKWHYMIDAPFKIGNQCCDHLKKNPMKQYNKRSGLKPIIGIMGSDSHNRRLDINKRGCNIYDTKDPQSRPLAYWTEEDIYKYIDKYKISICDIYNKGYDRTGCIFCMYGLQQEQNHTGKNRFQRMKKTHPKHYKFCMKKLGLKKILKFMNIKRK